MVREYLALVDPGSEYCIIPKVDAFALGYAEVAIADTVIIAPNSTTFATHNGYDRGTLIRMSEVDVGHYNFKNVEFLGFDILQVCGFDAVLGRSLLQSLRLEIDYPSGLITMEKTGD